MRKREKDLQENKKEEEEGIGREYRERGERMVWAMGMGS